MAIFPSNTSTDADLYIGVNNLSTVLTDDPLTSGATTVNVSDTTGFPTVGILTIDLEAIHYTGLTGTSFTGCTRGFDGTTAASHPKGTTVFHDIPAAHHNVLKDEIIALETYLRDKLNVTGDGSVSTPSYSFLSDPDTGIYRSGINELAFTTNGIERIKINAVGQTIMSTALLMGTGNSLRLDSGTDANPSLTFTGDLNTGIQNSAADQLAFVTNANRRLTIHNDRLQTNVTMWNINGSSTLPSYTFLNDTSTGVYLPSTNVLGFATSGTAQWQITSSGILATNATGNADGKILAGEGSASAPTYSFNITGRDGTGMYSSGVDQLAFTTGGVKRWAIGSSGGLTSFSGNINMISGSDTSPAYTFVNDPDTGIFNPATNELAFATNGLNQWRVTSGGILAIDATDNSSGKILAGAGSSSSPTYSFNVVGGATTGMYLSGTTTIKFVTNGTDRVSIFDGSIGVEGDTLPNVDNTYTLGNGSKRWADVQSVLINGADYGFANGYILREYPATEEDVQSKSNDWMKENANKGIQILNDLGEMIAVIDRDGTFYAKDYKTLAELPQ